MSHTCIHTHAHKLSYPHCYCHTLHAHSLTHTFTHTHFFWMIKSEESDHTIMWEMCFSDIIEMGKKRFLKQQYQKAKFFISLIKFFFSSFARMDVKKKWVVDEDYGKKVPISLLTHLQGMTIMLGSAVHRCHQQKKQWVWGSCSWSFSTTKNLHLNAIVLQCLRKLPTHQM